MERIYACIDLKSFYASVECVLRNLDPLTTNLVVADNTRTEKTICLAVSPSLKQYGIKGRARLFEVVSKVKEINLERRKNILNKNFEASSSNDVELSNNKYLKLDYIVAKPRMAKYIEYSSKIYDIYLKYISKEDIFVYSIDEVFMDITSYLKHYGVSAKELVTMIIKDVYKATGITATGGIGPNLYLAKVAMDIVAKHIPADECGVRVATLDVIEYRKTLWNHKPITDFWRVGNGYAKKLASFYIYTMGDIAALSIKNEKILYKLFGVNAEILIDHAWGYEPCTIKDIKNYKPKTNSISKGQVLSHPYNYDKTKLIIKEMSEDISLELVKVKKVTNQIVLNVAYDIINLNKKYDGEIKLDYYGRKVPKPAHGKVNLSNYTSSYESIKEATLTLFDRIIDKNLFVRKISICATNLIDSNLIKDKVRYVQCNLFEEFSSEKTSNEKNYEKLEDTIISIKEKYGKNSILKLMDLEEGSTTIVRNNEIGGHSA